MQMAAGGCSESGGALAEVFLQGGTPGDEYACVRAVVCVVGAMGRCQTARAAGGAVATRRGDWQRQGAELSTTAADAHTRGEIRTRAQLCSKGSFLRATQDVRPETCRFVTA